MPTVICAHCSEVVTVTGPIPDRCPSCGQTLATEDDSTRAGRQLGSTVLQIAERPRTTIGRYVVQSKLGAGGFGSVFLAQDPQLDRLVAIKVPRDDTGSTPIALERFAREGRNVAQLRHPGIVSVFNVELEGQLPFIVCEYVEGESLSDRLRKGPFSFNEAARIVAELALAVDYAHAQGIIHRDIKPSNIMISPDGRPRLMDFGLAKREAIDVTVTTDRAIVGTPAYMPPEQAWGGKQRAVDRRSDVYSLGAVLYQLLTREIPFHGEPRMVLRQVIEDDPKSPRSLNADIPLDLETICQKAMEKEPPKRYQTAGELSADLERWLRREPILARPIPRLERSWRWCRRNPIAAGLVTAVALLLTTIACSALVVAGQDRKAANASARLAQVEKGAHAAAEVARQKAVEKADELARLNRELSEMVSKSHVERGSEYLRWNDVASEYSPLKALPWFQAAMEIDEKHPTRRDASRLRMGALLRSAPSVRRAWAHGGAVSVLVVSPTGDRFFTGGHDGTGRLWSSRQDLPVGTALTHPADILAADFSPDGKLLLTGCANATVRLWETVGGKLVGGPLRVTSPSPSNRQPTYVGRVAFSRDGRLFLTVSGYSVRVFEVNGLKAVGKPCGGSAKVLAAEFADGARLLVTKALRGPISVWDVQTGAEKHRLIERSQRGLLLAVAAEGTIAAAAQSAESIVLWDCVSGKQAAVPSLAHQDKVLTARFSADGHRLATGTADGTVSLWSVADGRLLWKSRPSRAEVSDLEFLQRGSQLAVLCTEESERWVCILECDGGNLIGEPLHFYSPVRWTRWLGDTGDLLTTGGDGTVRLWGTQSVDSAFRLSPSSAIQSAAVSANRRAVVVLAERGASWMLRAGQGQPFSEKTTQTFNMDLNPLAAALSNDGSRLAVVADSAVAILDAHTGREIISRLEHSAPATRLRFTPNDDLLITISQNLGVLPQKCTITAWDARSGERKQQIDVGAYVTELDVRQKDNLCVIAGNNQGLIWDPVNGRSPSSFLAQGSKLSACRFSPDGSLILTGGIDGVARIWETTSAKQLAASPKSRGYITCVEFSPDGTRFATAHSNGTARIWRVADARPATGALVQGAAPSHCVFSADSRWLVTVSDGPLPDHRLETLVRGWDALTGELIFTRVMNRLAGQFPQRSSPSFNPWRIAAAFFAPDDRHFHVLTAGGLFVSLDLNQDVRPLADALRDVNLRSGAAFDRMGGLSFDGPSLPSSTSNTRDERND